MDKVEKIASLVLPNQLFEKSPVFSNDSPIYLVEEFLFFNQYSFHKQKLFFHRLSMKKYEHFLRGKGIDVQYIDASEKLSDIRHLIENISNKYNIIQIIDPNDFLVEKRLKRVCIKHNIKLIILENPMFLCNKSDLGFFKPDKKKFFQTSFYKSQREKFNIKR